MMGRVIFVNVLVIFFGIGTWLCVNGLWVELPLLVQKLPEGWNLPSYMAIVVQIANIGPLSYSILNSFFPTIVTEKRGIYFVMILGLCANILLAQFWEEKTVVFGSEHSTALLVLVFFLASVDCSSRVLYLPFMAQLQTSYLNAFFVGEGLSGFIPSIFALIQGVGGNPECRNSTDENFNGTVAHTPDPLFPVEAFFYLLFTVTLLSAIAFYLLNYYPIIQHALADNTSSPEGRGVLLNSTGTPFYQSTSNGNSPDCVRRMETSRISTIDADTVIVEPAAAYHKDVQSNISKSVYVYLLCNLALVCAMSNGVFPSIQTYSCLPYGNVVYHWTVSLSNMANPTVCFLAFYIPSPTKRSIGTVSVLAFAMSAYVMTTAVMSPNPPLVGELSGEILLVSSWILLVGMFTYVKVSIANMLRINGQRGLFWCGAVTQCGSAVGAIVTFFIVNFSDVFQSYYPCS